MFYVRCVFYSPLKLTRTVFLYCKLQGTIGNRPLSSGVSSWYEFKYRLPIFAHPHHSSSTSSFKSPALLSQLPFVFHRFGRPKPYIQSRLGCLASYPTQYLRLHRVKRPCCMEGSSQWCVVSLPLQNCDTDDSFRRCLPVSPLTSGPPP